jgi:putative ATPase
VVAITNIFNKKVGRMKDFFEHKPVAPLAELLRPTSLNDFVGQTHLLGVGKPLSMMLAAGDLASFILWGPSGTGKTSLARLVAGMVDAHLIELSAVYAGVKEIRGAVDQALQMLHQQRKSVLFVDEIHRFNKSQQDALLPHVESGLLILIGATTENPSFELNTALLSRAQVYVFQRLVALELDDLFQRAHRMLDTHFQVDEDAKQLMIRYADGDARRLLNLLERSHSAAKFDKITHLDLAFVERVLMLNPRQFDKGGDHFYEQISALHKSVRGSNPDAALYWLSSMLAAGVDPRYLARRIIRIAWEDIGLADPRAMQIANDAAITYERLGSPEGELALAQAVIYLSVAAKSNAGYQAYNAAANFVRMDHSRAVPMHLRNAPTTFMQQAGYGQAYRYAHDEPEAYAAGVSYWPDGLIAPQWYQPKNQGLEIKIADKLKHLKLLDELYAKAHESANEANVVVKKPR